MCHFVFLNLKTEKRWTEYLYHPLKRNEAAKVVSSSSTCETMIDRWFSSLLFYILHVLPLRGKLNTKHHPAPYSTTTLYHISWGVDAPDDDTLLKFFIGVFELV